MSPDKGRAAPAGARREVTVRIDEELARTLDEFCREKRVAADRVVERALIEYFREGDMSH